MTNILFKTLLAGLTLWKNKDARKYLDQVIKLKKQWYDEYNLPEFSDAKLDNIERELKIIAETFSSKIQTYEQKD